MLCWQLLKLHYPKRGKIEKLNYPSRVQLGLSSSNAQSDIPCIILYLIILTRKKLRHQFPELIFFLSAGYSLPSEEETTVMKSFLSCDMIGLKHFFIQSEKKQNKTYCDFLHVFSHGLHQLQVLP